MFDSAQSGQNRERNGGKKTSRWALNVWRVLTTSVSRSRLSAPGQPLMLDCSRAGPIRRSARWFHRGCYHVLRWAGVIGPTRRHKVIQLSLARMIV